MRGCANAAYLLSSDFERYELTQYCDKNQIDLLVVPMNWLLPDEEIDAYKAGDANDPSIPTINYWVARCIPLWVPGMEQPGHEGHKTLFVACNRTGTEKGTCVGLYRNHLCGLLERHCVHRRRPGDTARRRGQPQGRRAHRRAQQGVGRCGRMAVCKRARQALLSCLART